MKKVYTYLAIALIIILSLIPPINFFISNPSTDKWLWIVLIAAFFGFYTIFIKTCWFVRVFAIGAFLNCFFAVSPYMAFTAYISTVLTCYFFILCSKIEDWTPLFKALQVVLFLNIFLLIMQSMGHDTLLNFTLGKDITCFGTIGHHMQMGSFSVILAAFLILFNPLNFIFPFVVALFCSSTWTLFSAGVGLFIYTYARNKKLAITLAVICLICFVGLSMVKGKFVANTALNGRAMVWAKSIQLANERPLTGWGIGTYKDLFYPLSHINSIPYRTAHNWLIQLLFETGYVFTAVILGMLAWVFYILWRFRMYDVAAGFAMILTDMMVHFPERMIQCVLIMVCFLAYAYQRLHKIHRV